MDQYTVMGEPEQITVPSYSIEEMQAEQARNLRWAIGDDLFDLLEWIEIRRAINERHLHDL